MSKARKKPRAPADNARQRFLTRGVVIGAGILLAALVAWPLYWWRYDATRPARKSAGAVRASGPVSVLGGKLVFRDEGLQAREFLGYHSSIRLTAQQEAIKREVLEAMPAACCSRSNAYTCCCTCNLSKSVWGLSNYVLTQYHANADELRSVVRAWLDYTNPGGHTGRSCYTGSCELAFRDNGCGGMSESDLVL